MRSVDNSINNKQTATIVIFCGALWGLSEATLGYLLHLLPKLTGFPPIAGFIMFPVGAVIMLTAAGTSRRPAAALYTAFIAAGIKALSAASPAVSWLFVQNPVIAILLQGLAIRIVAQHLAKSGKNSVLSIKTKLLPAFAAGFAWRASFILLHIGLGIHWGVLSRGLGAVMGFLVLDSAVNALLIFLVLSINSRSRLRQHFRKAAAHPALEHPALAALALAAALSFEVLPGLL